MCTIRVEEELRGAIVHGDSEVVGNYRGIVLGSCVAKVFTRLLTKRLEYLEDITEAQTGEVLSKEKMFRPGIHTEGSL